MSGLIFKQLRARYEAALAEERAHDASVMPGTVRGFVSGEAEIENERLTCVRYMIESEMMDVPSPDAAAFAFKYLVAHGDNRETDCWDAMLEEEEAKRFSTLSDCSADPHMDWLAERDAILRPAHTTDIDDDECSEIVGRAVIVENRIISTPATTRDGVLAKALIVVADGIGPSDDNPAALVFGEAKALGLVEYEG